MILFKLTLASPAPTFFLSKLLIAEAAMLASSMFKSRALRTTIARKSDIVTYHPHNATRDVPEDGDMTERSHAGMPSLHSHQSCTGWCARPRYMSPSVSLSLSVSAWESFDSDSPDWQTGSNISRHVPRTRSTTDSDGKQCKQSTLVRKVRHNRMSGFFANGGPKPGRGQSQLAEIAAFKT